MTRTVGVTATGITGCVPVIREVGKPFSPPPGIPIPRTPPGPGSGASGAAGPDVVEIVRGIRPGATKIGRTVLVGIGEACPLRGVAVAGRSGRPRVIGVETVRAAGSPTDFHSGN